MTITAPTIWPNDNPRARRHDPITSHEAADTNDVTRSIGLVLAILTERGPMADDQIEVWAALHHQSKFTGQRLRTARRALVDQGKVQLSDIPRLTKNNRRTRVWEVAA